MLLVLFQVNEQPLGEKQNKRKTYSRKQVLSYIFHQPALWAMMVLTMIVQTGNFSIQPLLALYVNELHGPVNLAFSPEWRFQRPDSEAYCLPGNGGLRRPLRPQPDLNRAFDCLSGVFHSAGARLLPLHSVSLQISVRHGHGRHAPLHYGRNPRQGAGQHPGEVLGYNVSFRFLGNVLGPLLGGAVSSGFSISAAFYVTAFLLIGAGLLWMAGHLQKDTASNAG